MLCSTQQILAALDHQRFNKLEFNDFQISHNKSQIVIETTHQNEVSDLKINTIKPLNNLVLENILNQVKQFC